MIGWRVGRRVDWSVDWSTAATVSYQMDVGGMRGAEAAIEEATATISNSAKRRRRESCSVGYLRRVDELPK